MQRVLELTISDAGTGSQRDVDLDAGTVTVRASAADLPGGHRHIGPPKSDAGRRTVTIPEAILDAVTDHIDRFAQPGPDGLVFVGPRGGVLRDANFGPPPANSVLSTCTSTTCATPATLSPPRPAPAFAS